MKYTKILESKKIPKYGWINFNHNKSDANSIVNKLKRSFPDYIFGIKNNKIHMDGKVIFDLSHKPLDFSAVVAKMKNMIATEDEAVSNIADADIAKKPSAPGGKDNLQKRKRLRLGLIDDKYPNKEEDE